MQLYQKLTVFIWVATGTFVGYLLGRASHNIDYRAHFADNAQNTEVQIPRKSCISATNKKPSQPASMRLTYLGPSLRNVEDSPLAKEPVSRLLDPASVSRNVVMAWCGQKRIFRFHNYLSVLSIIRFVRPYDIVFYYEEEPTVDSSFYNTWLAEIKDKYPFFHLKKLRQDEHGCVRGKPNLTFIMDTLLGNHSGGIYVNEETLLTSSTYLRLRHFDNVDAINETTGHGFILVNVKDTPSNGTTPMLQQTSCVDQGQYTGQGTEEFCIDMPKFFFPKDIWGLDSAFARIARSLFYGKEDVLAPKQSYDDLIPNIGHVIWLGGGKMSYTFFLCCLSFLYVLEVDTLYVHGDTPPTGPYWDRLKTHQRIEFIKRINHQLVFGTTVKRKHHVADIWRVDILMRFGGIYLDTDGVFVRPIEQNLRAYDVVASYGLKNIPFFPHGIAFGGCMGKRNATFWSYFLQSMKWFRADNRLWNGVVQPYKIAERHPDLIRIDPHWQIICINTPSRCYPSWAPNYPRDRTVHHLSKNSTLDWRKDSHIFHFVTDPKLRDEATTMKTEGMFGEIGRFILNKAKANKYKDNWTGI